MMQVSALIRVFKFMLLEGIGVFTLTLKMKMWEKQQRLLWKCSHKEEHSRMLFNAWFKSRPNTLVINTADTDFLVITLWNTPKVFQGLKAWLEIGLTSDKYTSIWNNAAIAKPPNFNLKTAAGSSKKKKTRSKSYNLPGGNVS